MCIRDRVGFADASGNIFDLNGDLVPIVCDIQAVPVGDPNLATAGAAFCSLIATDAALGALDCDGGGADNAAECAAGGNPLDTMDDCDIPGITQPVCTVGVGNIGPAGVPLDGTTAPYMATPNCLLVDNAEAIAYRGFMIGCNQTCLLYTSPSPRDATLSRMPSSA